MHGVSHLNFFDATLVHNLCHKVAPTKRKEKHREEGCDAGWETWYQQQRDGAKRGGVSPLGTALVVLMNAPVFLKTGKGIAAAHPSAR